MGVYLIGILIGAILIICLFILFANNRLAKRPFRSQKLAIHGKTAAKKKISRQSCSYCKKKANKITFYSNGHKVVGVCDLCRPHAERQALMRL